MINRLILAVVAIAACGGSKKPAPAAPPPVEKKVEAPPVEKAPEPAPAPPKKWHAKAALTPAKGSKLQPATVSFTQEEGQGTNVSSDAGFEGLKPGTYHLVIHDGAECGADAKKAGAVWPGGANAPLDVTAGKDSKGAVDVTGAKLTIDGDVSIVGHTLVLHADAKGKPGKALACGPIEAVGAE